MNRMITTSRISGLSALLSATVLSATLAPQALAATNSNADSKQCAAIKYPTVQQQPAPLHTDGMQIKDAQGRVVLLRGINTSGDSKVPDFMPLKSASMLDPLKALGINTLRLLFTWEAFEPTRCQYDTSYMDYYEQVVRWAAERDIYVIVDFHQDAYSRFSIDGCGEGFPEWSIHSSIRRDTPDNSKSCERWGLKMFFDPSHHLTWRHFHRDTEGAKTRYIAMATEVAERMAKHPNVIGYEIINEPWGTRRELETLYHEVGTAIRSRHPDTLLFIPPHALSSSGAPSFLRKPTLDNIVYAPHYYDPTVLVLSSWWGRSPDFVLNGMARKAARWNVPLLLGEYGGPANTKNIEGYMDALNGWMNKGFHHGTQWNYTPTWRDDTKDGWNHEDLSIVDNTGQLRPNFRPRVYPTATAGTPIAFEETKQYATYRWNHDPKQGATTFFVPADFMNNKTLTTDGVTCETSAFTLSCQAEKSGVVSITIDDLQIYPTEK